MPLVKLVFRGIPGTIPRNRNRQDIADIRLAYFGAVHQHGGRRRREAKDLFDSHAFSLVILFTHGIVRRDWRLSYEFLDG